MKDLFIDIEALGRRPGCAVIQLGAIVFDPDSGESAEEFHRYIQPGSWETADLDTLAWHANQGTYPHPDGTAAVSTETAMTDFLDWLTDLETAGHVIDDWWSWGITYDFPILEPIFDASIDRVPPWSYWQPADARTVWKLAFPGVRHSPRPHHALEDCWHGIRDLCSALAKLRGEEGQPA